MYLFNQIYFNILWNIWTGKFLNTVSTGHTAYPKSIRTFAHEEFSSYMWLLMPLIAALGELRQKEHGESSQTGLKKVTGKQLSIWLLKCELIFSQMLGKGSLRDLTPHRGVLNWTKCNFWLPGWGGDVVILITYKSVFCLRAVCLPLFTHAGQFSGRWTPLFSFRTQSTFVEGWIMAIGSAQPAQCSSGPSSEDQFLEQSLQ